MTDRPQFTKCDAIRDCMTQLDEGEIVQIYGERFIIDRNPGTDADDPTNFFFRPVKNADAGRLTDSPGGFKRIKAEV